MTKLVEEREKMVEQWRQEAAAELTSLGEATPYEKITKSLQNKKKDQKKWRDAEKHLQTGVNTGSSLRTQQQEVQKAEKKEEEDMQTRKR